MLTALMMMSLASAQQRDVEIPVMDTQLFRPAIDATQMLWTEDALRARSGTGSARLVVDYANRPLVYHPAEGEPIALISDAVQANAIGAVTLGPVRAAVDLPVYLLTAGERAGTGAGLGDVAFALKGTVLDRRESPIGLALLARIGLPTSTVDLPLGASGPMGEVGLAVDRGFGPLLVAANAGARFNPEVELENVTVDDQLFLRLGTAWAFTPNAGVSVEAGGHANFSSPVTNVASVPIEGLIGGWGRLGDGLVLRGGIGTGLTTGIGTPAARVIASVGWEPRDDPDSDADGVVNRLDSCPDRPEDLDFFEDDDGCPEDATEVRFIVIDTFGDPIRGMAELRVHGDGTDEARTDESKLVLAPGGYTVQAVSMGYEPGYANFDVPVGVPVEVRVPLTPEISTGMLAIRVLDPAGEPLPSATWHVAGSDETYDAAHGHGDHATGTELDEGRYEIEVSAPGYLPVTDQVDVARNARTEHTIQLEPRRVVITHGHIDLGETVYFDTNLDTIKAESTDLLDEVVRVMQEHPELELIRVEGHTDARGSEADNLDLSKRRAAAVVRYLADHGVEPERLESEGYGESMPIDPASTPEAWEQNRRVEITILERAEGPVEH